LAEYQDVSDEKDNKGGRSQWPPYHWLNSPDIKPVADDFWNPQFNEQDLTMYNRFLKILRLSKNGLNSDEIGKILQMNNVRKYLAGSKMSFLTLLRTRHDTLGSPINAHKWLPTRLKPRGTPGNSWIQVPDLPLSFSIVDSLVRRLPYGATQNNHLNDFGFKSQEELQAERTNLFGFLLGVVVGDASKRTKGITRFVSRSISLVLSKNKPNSLRFGEFTTFCANVALGLDMHRIKDLPISISRYGKTECYAWNTTSSPINSWVFNACLGLKDGETTTYDPLHMDWILESPRSFVTHFIQGLAESDGWPDAGHDVVKVVSSPNTKLFKRILDNLGCPAQVVNQPPVQLLRCNTEDAAKLPFFSPRIHSKLYENMQTMAHARHYPARVRLPQSTIDLISESSKTITNSNEICLNLAKTLGYKISSDTVRKYSES